MRIKATWISTQTSFIGTSLDNGTESEIYWKLKLMISNYIYSNERGIDLDINIIQVLFKRLQYNITFPINAGTGLALTRDANALLTLEAMTTDRHWVLRTPSFEVFIDLTQITSAAVNSGTNCWTNPRTTAISSGCLTDTGLAIPEKTRKRLFTY